MWIYVPILKFRVATAKWSCPQLSTWDFGHEVSVPLAEFQLCISSWKTFGLDALRKRGNATRLSRVRGSLPVAAQNAAGGVEQKGARYCQRDKLPVQKTPNFVTTTARVWGTAKRFFGALLLWSLGASNMPLSFEVARWWVLINWNIMKYHTWSNCKHWVSVWGQLPCLKIQAQSLCPGGSCSRAFLRGFPGQDSVYRTWQTNKLPSIQ